MGSFTNMSYLFKFDCILLLSSKVVCKLTLALGIESS